MKTLLLALRLLTVALATACDRRDDFANALTADAVAADTPALPATDSAPPASVNPGAEPTTSVATPGSDDALALGLFSVVDAQEIQADQQVIAKPVTGGAGVRANDGNTAHRQPDPDQGIGPGGRFAYRR
ncbi:MAG: hypothetical protein ABIO17_06680 [Pseudoxanthomonas sp.]